MLNKYIANKMFLKIHGLPPYPIVRNVAFRDSHFKLSTKKAVFVHVYTTYDNLDQTWSMKLGIPDGIVKVC